MKKPSAVERFEIRLRNKRFSFFEALLKPLPRPVRILDVGGTIGFWNHLDYSRLGRIEVTLLNLLEQKNLPPSFRFETGDARCLKACRSENYDVVFSNSVIAHVGALADQKQMADEIRRVGRNYFVQTPNHYFPIDWRTLVPFFHYLPVKRQAWLLHHFPISSFGRISPYSKALAWAGCVRHLTYRELNSLFPEAGIAREKLFGFTKSYMVYKGFGRP